MAKTPEQILREIVAEQVFQIAKLASEVDRLNEENQKLIAETEARKEEKKNDS